MRCIFYRCKHWSEQEETPFFGVECTVPDMDCPHIDDKIREWEEEEHWREEKRAATLLGGRHITDND